MSHLGCKQSQAIQSLSNCHSGHGTDLEFCHDLKVQGGSKFRTEFLNFSCIHILV